MRCANAVGIAERLGVRRGRRPHHRGEAIAAQREITVVLDQDYGARHVSIPSYHGRRQLYAVDRSGWVLQAGGGCDCGVGGRAEDAATRHTEGSSGGTGLSIDAMTENERYRRKWALYRRLRNWFWALTLGCVPAIFALVWILRRLNMDLTFAPLILIFIWALWEFDLIIWSVQDAGTRCSCDARGKDFSSASACTVVYLSSLRAVD